MKKYIVLFLIVLTISAQAQTKITDSLEPQAGKQFGISSVMVFGVIGMLVMTLIGVIVLIFHFKQKAKANAKEGWP